MALPVGVTTATITFGVPVSFTGGAVRSTVSIVPSASLVHVATGTPLVNFIEDVITSEGVSGQFTLPHTDQLGFQDESGNSYQNWYYTATISYSAGKATLPPRTKTFQLPTGQTTVDLDLLPAGAPVLPYSAQTAVVTSFAGRTGAITVQDSDLPTRLSDASLNATYAQIGPQGLYVDAKLLTGATAAANTSALNAAMTTAATYGATVFIPAGTYSLNSVSVTAPLRGAGRGATILNGVRLIFAGSGVTISDLKLHSTDPVAFSASGVNDLALVNVEVSHDPATVEPLALSGTNVQRLRVTGCKFGVAGVQLSTVNDFVYDANYTDAQYLNVNEPLHISQQSSGVVTNSTFKNTLTDAIDLYSSGEYCVINGNRFYGLKGASGIECKVTMGNDPGNSSGPGNLVDGVIISNNILKDFIPQNAGSGRAGIYAEFVDSRGVPTYAVPESNRAMIITGNVLEDFNVADPGFAVSYSGIAFTGHNGLIANNVIRNIRSWTGTPAGINLAWSATAQQNVGVRVSGNVIAGIEDGYGIQTGNMNECQINDNIVRQDDVSGRQTKHGLNVIAGVTLSYCTIEGNTFSCNTSTSFGLRATSATTVFSRCVIQGNILKDCGVSVSVAQYCTFMGNTMDNATNSNIFSVGVAGTSARGNIYSGNHITMSADYGLGLADHDGFVITGNTFNNTARAVLLTGLTKNGVIDNNISIIQTLGAEFPHYSGVSAPDQATITVGANKVLT